MTQARIGEWRPLTLGSFPRESSLFPFRLSDDLTEIKKRLLSDGLTPQDMRKHDWSDKATVLQTEGYIVNRPANMSARTAMDTIRGFNAQQIRLFHDHGLSREDMKEHNWSDQATASQTEVYIANRPANMSARTAMDAIRGFNAQQIRLFRDHSLTREDMKEHDWSDKATRLQTEGYIVNRPGNVRAQTAMDEIRGLNFQEIQQIPSLRIFAAVTNQATLEEILSRLNEMNIGNQEPFQSLEQAQEFIAELEIKTPENVFKGVFQGMSLSPSEILVFKLMRARWGTYGSEEASAP